MKFLKRRNENVRPLLYVHLFEKKPHTIWSTMWFIFIFTVAEILRRNLLEKLRLWSSSKH